MSKRHKLLTKEFIRNDLNYSVTGANRNIRSFIHGRRYRSFSQRKCTDIPVLRVLAVRTWSTWAPQSFHWSISAFHFLSKIRLARVSCTITMPKLAGSQISNFESAWKARIRYSRRLTNDLNNVFNGILYFTYTTLLALQIR